MTAKHSVFLITPPDIPGKYVDRVLSAGIGVVLPTYWTDKFRNIGRGKPKPNRELPAMETLYAASVAEKAGAEVQLLDIGLEEWYGEEALAKTLAMLPKQTDDRSLWLGVKINLPTLLSDLAFARDIKAARPDSKVFIHGSPVMTTLDHWVKGTTTLDAIIFGELEEIIGSMIKADTAGKNWKSIAGVIDPPTYKAADSSILFDKTIVKSFDNWQRVKQLGDLPAPAWHLVPFARYSPTGDPKDCGVHVQASRGCPIGCTMCPYMVHEGRPFRANPVRPGRLRPEIPQRQLRHHACPLPRSEFRFRQEADG